MPKPVKGILFAGVTLLLAGVAALLAWCIPWRTQISETQPALLFSLDNTVDTELGVATVEGVFTRQGGDCGRFRGSIRAPGLPEGPVRGHEFHYWDCTENGELCLARKPSGGRSWRCMERKKGVTAGFPHLYYPSNPGVPGTFLEKCRVFREERHHD